MKKPLPIGRDNFKDIRRNDFYYVDKTLLIQELLDKKGEVSLFTRPRRFGKTLNMSMTECFFSNRYGDRADLFEGLTIWKEKSYRKLQGTLPVLFLSFAKVKGRSYEEMRFSMASIIFDIY